MSRCLLTALLLCFCLLPAAQAQSDSSFQNLYFVQKGESPRFDSADYLFSKKGFYIYRNCIYNVVLRNRIAVTIKVIDIRNDSILCTAQRNKGYDTLHLHPSDLLRLRLQSGEAYGMFSSRSFRPLRYVFERSDTAKAFPVKTELTYNEYTNSDVTYSIVPIITGTGLSQRRERLSETYYCQGVPSDTPCPKVTKPEKQRPSQTRNIAWVTTSNATEINGLALGVQTTNLHGDPLRVNGLNVDAGLLSAFGAMYTLFLVGYDNVLGEYSDTLDKSDIKIRVKGLSLSGGGLAGDLLVHGLSINGGILVAEEAVGLHITGMQSMVQDFKGVVVSGLRNKSMRGRGLQVSLLNICRDFKGVQIGLWNVNAKRKLPIINWDF